MLKITLTKSLIGFAANQHRVARALGLGKDRIDRLPGRHGPDSRDAAQDSSRADRRVGRRRCGAAAEGCCRRR